MPSEITLQLNEREKRGVRVGVLLIRVLWFSFLLPFVSEGFWLAAKSSAQPARAMFFSVAVLSALVFLGACGTLIVLTFHVRCPSCGWALLRNPKGVGPTGFVAHSACPRGTLHYFGMHFLPVYRISPWTVQMLRVRTEKRIICLQCGSDFALRTAKPDIWSNQLPDPTSPSVTPPARAGVAPSIAADH